MALSQGALQAVLASATDQVFLECLTISHSEMAEPLRLVNDKVDLARALGTYHRFPFRVVAPAQTEERPPTLRIVASTVDQRLIIAIRALAGLKEQAKIVYEVVREEDHYPVLLLTADGASFLTSEGEEFLVIGKEILVEFGPVEFEFESATSNGLTQVTIDASFLRGALHDQFPGRLIAPSNATA